MKKLTMLCLSLAAMLALLFTALPAVAPAAAQEPEIAEYATYQELGTNPYQGNVEGEQGEATAWEVTWRSDRWPWPPIKLPPIEILIGGVVVHDGINDGIVDGGKGVGMVNPIINPILPIKPIDPIRYPWPRPLPITQKWIEIQTPGPDSTFTYGIESEYTRETRWGSITIYDVENTSSHETQRLLAIEGDNFSILLGRGVFLINF